MGYGWQTSVADGGLVECILAVRQQLSSCMAGGVVCVLVVCVSLVV